MRLTTRAVRATVAALVLQCAAQAIAADRRIADVEAEDFRFGSMAIGQAKDLDYARAEGLGLVPASPIDAYLNGILAKLLAQSPVRGVPARVYLRASGDWAARTTADANIYVALGTLLRLDHEDEVAALLAHEAAHVILGHADADVVSGLQQRAMQLSTLATEAQEVFQGGSPTGRAEHAEASADARIEEQSQALLLNTMILVPAWTRGQERDADVLGIDLLARAGYSPSAMTSLLRKQQQVEIERAADREVSSLDRQLFGVDVNTEVREQTERAVQSVGLEDPGLGKVAGGALGSIFEWGAKKVDDVKRSHPKTEERIEIASRYIAREYPGDAPQTLQVERWEAAKEQEGTAEVLENYIAAIEAKEMLRAGDLFRARKLSKASLTGPTSAHAYPNYVEAALDLAIGGSPAAGMALEAYETALAGPEPAGAIYTEASALYFQTGRSERACEVIEAGYRRLQEPPSLTVALIRTYRALGRQTDANRIAAECAARWPKLQTLCREQATRP